LENSIETVTKLKEYSARSLLGDEKTDEIITEENTKIKNDSYYKLYDTYHIHYEMLEDKVRTTSYRDFIYRNKNLIKDKVVLDLGCGTGILSLFAASSGAKHVIAVDKSNTIHKAIEIAFENGYQDKITFIHSEIEKVESLGKFQKVDVIISEWMGYGLLYESMLYSVIYARDRWLNEDGHVFPDRTTMNILAISDSHFQKKKISFWDDIYGFKMTGMKKSMLNEVHVDNIPPDSVITDPLKFMDFDIKQVKSSDLLLDKDFSLKVNKTSEMNGFLLYFDVFFERGCEEPISFSTGPFSTFTHWGHAILPFEEVIKVEQNDIIEGKITIEPLKSRKFTIEIQFKIEGKQPIIKKQYQI